ncbi:MAG: hypothetical protein KGL39_21275 [Patescibacteria group bacterium]|nr:hypothetical protein [Patescibacteria group bacterium]
MPIYEYTDVKTGEVVELNRPVELRDEVPKNLVRRVVSGPAVLRGAAMEEGAAYKVPRALREVERAGASAGDISRHFGMPVGEIKRVWGMQ